MLINGKGPFRLVLDTGANRSAITERTAQILGASATEEGATRVTGFTGSAIVPTVHVNEMDVGDVLIAPADLPVLADVFGGAQGVLGIEGMAGKRIYADFTHDQLAIDGAPTVSRRDAISPPCRCDSCMACWSPTVMVGTVRAKAIIDAECCARALPSAWNLERCADGALGATPAAQCLPARASSV